MRTAWLRAIRAVMPVAITVLVVGLIAGTLLTIHARQSTAGVGGAGSPATTQHEHPIPGAVGVSYICEPDALYSCTSASGYKGTNATGWAEKYYGCPDQASGCAAGTPHNCTLYAAYRLMQANVSDPGWHDNANGWANQASRHGVLVDQVAADGAIAQWNGGTSGHVAYVEASDASGITITMDDYYTSAPDPNGYTAEVHIATNSPAWPDNFIHFRDIGFYANKIVQWNGDTKTQKTSWYVSPDLKRYWIPSSSIFYCLEGQGIVNAGPLSSQILDQLQDQTGQWAKCSSASPPMAPVAAVLTPTPSSPPVSIPTVTSPPVSIPTVTPTPVPAQPVDAYSNYGPANTGYPICRGNPGNTLSMPGGTISQTFTVPGGVASLNSAMVQIDPDATVTAHLSIAVNGVVAATTDAAAAGDTHFNFASVSVSAGDVVTLSISFTATYGKIITVYTAGDPGGTFATADTCPDGASNVSLTNTGLRAVVYGMS